MIKTNKLYMAPMAGITDRAFREIVMENGADKTVTEMISTKGLYYKDENTSSLLERQSGENLGVQIFGSDPDIIAEVIDNYINPLDFEFIDFNMGCPAPKIFNNGDGSALMGKEDLAYEIMEKMVEASNKPIHIKIRLGINDKNKNYLEISKLAEKAGVSKICLHARTKSQFYTGKADWQAIKTLVETVNIPVIANGDITNAKDALDILELTKCDSLMIGRAALGNPFVFEEIKCALEQRPYEEPSIEKLYDTIKAHYEKIISYKGPRAVAEMRKHIAWYLKGLPGSAKVKDKINKLESLDDIKKTLDEYMNKLI